MRISEMPFEGSMPIEGYGPNMFRIGGEVYEGAILAFGAGVESWGGYDDTASLIALKDDVDVLIVGTGHEMTHLPPAFRDALEEAAIGVEQMATDTACRSYNVLASEGRRVAVALLPL